MTEKISAKTLKDLESLANGESAIIQSACLKEVVYELGSPGRHGHGFLHIVEKRIKEGKSLEDAIDVAIAVAESDQLNKKHTSFRQRKN